MTNRDHIYSHKHWQFILKEDSVVWRVLLIPYFLDDSLCPVYSLWGKF